MDIYFICTPIARITHTTVFEVPVVRVQDCTLSTKLNPARLSFNTEYWGESSFSDERGGGGGSR